MHEILKKFSVSLMMRLSFIIPLITLIIIAAIGVAKYKRKKQNKKLYPEHTYKRLISRVKSEWEAMNKAEQQEVLKVLDELINEIPEEEKPKSTRFEILKNKGNGFYPV